MDQDIEVANTTNLELSQIESFKKDYLIQSNTMALLPSLFTANKLPDHAIKQEDGSLKTIPGRSRPVNRLVTYFSEHEGNLVKKHIHFNAGYGLLRPFDEELLTVIFHLFWEKGNFDFTDEIKVNRSQFKTQKKYEDAYAMAIRKQISSHRDITISRDELVKEMNKSMSSWTQIDQSLRRMANVTINKIEGEIDNDDPNSIGGESSKILESSFPAYKVKGRIELSTNIMMDFLMGDFFIIDLDWMNSVPRGRNRYLLKFIAAKLFNSDKDEVFVSLDQILYDVMLMPKNDKIVRQNKGKLKNLLITFENNGILEKSLTIPSEYRDFEVFGETKLPIIIDDNLGLTQDILTDSVCLRSGEKLKECKRYKAQMRGLMKKVGHSVSIPNMNTEKKRHINDSLHKLGLNRKYIDFYFAACFSDCNYPDVCERRDKTTQVYGRVMKVVNDGIEIREMFQGELSISKISMSYKILEERLEYLELFLKYDPQRNSFIHQKAGWFRSLIERGNYDPIKHEELLKIDAKKQEKIKSKAAVSNAKKKDKVAQDMQEDKNKKLNDLKSKMPVDGTLGEVMVSEPFVLKIFKLAAFKFEKIKERILNNSFAVRKGETIYVVLGNLIHGLLESKNAIKKIEDWMTNNHFETRCISEDFFLSEFQNHGENEDVRVEQIYDFRDEEDLTIITDDIVNNNIDEYKSGVESIDQIDDEETSGDLNHLDEEFEIFYEQLLKAPPRALKMMLNPYKEYLSVEEKKKISEEMTPRGLNDSIELKAILFKHYKEPETFDLFD
jgi:hypothetical protein